MITHPPASCALSPSHPALRTSLGIASLSTPRHFLHPCKLQLLRHHLHATRWTVCLEHSTPALLVRTWILTPTGSTPTPEPVPVLTSLMFPYALHCMEYYIVFFRDKSAGNTLKSARMESLCIERKCCMWVLSLWIRYPDIHSYMYDSASLVFTFSVCWQLSGRLSAQQSICASANGDLGFCNPNPLIPYFARKKNTLFDKYLL